MIAKMYKLLLRFEMKEEPAIECMVKWVKYFVDNIQIDKWEQLWLKVWNSSYNLKETFFKKWYTLSIWHQKKCLSCKKELLISDENVTNLKEYFIMHGKKPKDIGYKYILIQNVKI